MDVPTRLSDDGELLFVASPARQGFVWRALGLALIPENQILRRRAARPSRIGRALQSFADLRSGDYVVHEDHGVGKLLGFETKTVAGVTRDYLFIAFRGDDRLYVPHDQVDKVSRYVGSRRPSARRLPSSAAAPGSCSRTAHDRPPASSQASCSRSMRSAARPRASPTT